MARVLIDKTAVETAYGCTLADSSIISLAHKTNSPATLFPNLGNPDYYVIDCQSILGGQKCQHLEVQFAVDATSPDDAFVLLTGDYADITTEPLKNMIVLPFSASTAGGGFSLEKYFVGTQRYVTIALLSTVKGGISGGTLTDVNIFISQ